jgi:hypothetical protein
MRDYGFGHAHQTVNVDAEDGGNILLAGFDEILA